MASELAEFDDLTSEPDPWDSDEPTRARILWVKNLTRIRQQVRVAAYVLCSVCRVVCIV